MKNREYIYKIAEFTNEASGCVMRQDRTSMFGLRCREAGFNTVRSFLGGENGCTGCNYRGGLRRGNPGEGGMDAGRPYRLAGARKKMAPSWIELVCGREKPVEAGLFFQFPNIDVIFIYELL
jgi:hypothetical protein